MIYLSLSILSTTLIFVVFKLFDRYGIDNHQAIVVNYLMATLFGSLLLIPEGIDINPIGEPWLLHAAIIGISFIFIFNLIALTSQKIGVSVASVSNKMSVIIPVIFALILYDDSMSWLKGSGIILAMAGVFMASKKGGYQQADSKYIYLPVILFVSSGLIDTFVKYTQHHHLDERNTIQFIPVVFFFAFLGGLVYTLFQKPARSGLKNILWGVILSIPNYGSIYFLIKTLDTESFESSMIFPVNNMGIVAISALAAFAIFREKLSAMNWAGIAISLIAILMISVS